MNMWSTAALEEHEDTGFLVYFMFKKYHYHYCDGDWVSKATEEAASQLQAVESMDHDK
jgi:hypothetical protein